MSVEIKHSSIITVKVGSWSMDCMFSIDKIVYRPMRFIDLKELRAYWNQEKIEYKSKHLTSSNYHGIEALGILFLYMPDSNDRCNMVITNPNHFYNFTNYMKSLARVIPQAIFNTLNISTLDLAFDIFNKDFIWVNRHLKVQAKQKIERFINDSNGQNIQYGGKPSVIKLYDKIKRILKARKIPHHASAIFGHVQSCVRIEVSLSKKSKLPTKDIFKLKKALLNKHFNPFKGIHFIEYNYIYDEPLNTVCTQDDIDGFKKYIELKTLHDHNGFQYIFKKYKKLVGFKKIFKIYNQYSIGKIYHLGIEHYFKELTDD